MERLLVFRGSVAVALSPGWPVVLLPEGTPLFKTDGAAMTPVFFRHREPKSVGRRMSLRCDTIWFE
jgi:hypothetical protein